MIGTRILCLYFCTLAGLVFVHSRHGLVSFCPFLPFCFAMESCMFYMCDDAMRIQIVSDARKVPVVMRFN